MIADQDVVNIYRQLPAIQLGSTDAERNFREPQFFKGISVRQEHPMGCSRCKGIFTTFGAIPKFCFDCYKVQVAPRNIMELFKLLMIFERITLPFDNIRKCMVEVRDECSGTYKGLIYCHGLDEGNEILEFVRGVVAENISPDVSVTLKRGCSEFEKVYPEFARVTPGVAPMPYRNEWQAYEDTFDAYLVSQGKGGPFVKADFSDFEAGIYTDSEIFCMQYWLRYAATIGDTSYLAITGMTMPPIPHLKRPPFKNEIPRSGN